MSRYMYSDIDIELSKYTDGDVTRDTEIEAIKNSIKNIVNTMPGSRRMLPNFAGNFHNLLFEPIDEITGRELGYSLVEAIRTWDDRVIIENIDVISVPDYNKYECTLNFRVKDSNEPREVKFILYRN